MAARPLSLLRSKAWIGGRWSASANGATFPVFDPCNGEKIAEVQDLGAEDTDAAIREAYKARKTWGNQVALVSNNITIYGSKKTSYCHSRVIPGIPANGIAICSNN